MVIRFPFAPSMLPRLRARPWQALVVGAVAASLACSRRPPPGQSAAPRSGPVTTTSAPPRPDDDALPVATNLPVERRAIQVVAGQERLVDAEVARAGGQTLVDLSDGWAPPILEDGVASDGAPLPNRYRSIYVGLANDRGDGDGQALPSGARNFLELYGIPPSFSVLRRRFLEDAERTVCEATVDVAKLVAVDGIETWGSATEKKELLRRAARSVRLETAREEAGLPTWEALVEADPKWTKEVKTQQRFLAERAAFAEIEKRLECEGLLDLRRHKAGTYDTPMRLAMLDFQQKNVVMDQADITRATLEALARPLQVNNFAALRRSLLERVVHAGGILEDGSVNLTGRGRPRKPATYKTAGGTRLPVPDLVGQATDATMERLGLRGPADALAFFRRHPVEDLTWLRVAVRFPPLPEYYGPQMDLFAEIDRGDVWYDFPFDARGKRVPQPREKYPSFALFVKWQGEKVPLVRWRTTIGSWRSELAADGEEYYRYKGSDVGPRVWRHIVASPVWIPPLSSPLGSMVKTKLVSGSPARVTNYDETGPGYLSAYGLVAGIHEQVHRRPGGNSYFDNGIRTHGSFDYMSLRGRFSHGCHRLYNNLAVRMFSFVIRHRKVRVLGPMALNARRTFWSEGELFDMRLPTRGFYYELDPPVPVETLEGEIKGTVQKPPQGYVRKPGVVYNHVTPPVMGGGPDDKAGGGGE